VVVSHALLERTSPDGLQAVLTHERYFDPLKVVLARALVRGFLLPASATRVRGPLPG
jgi:hypothetical protein